MAFYSNWEMEGWATVLAELQERAHLKKNELRTWAVTPKSWESNNIPRFHCWQMSSQVSLVLSHNLTDVYHDMGWMKAYALIDTVVHDVQRGVGERLKRA